MRCPLTAEAIRVAQTSTCDSERYRFAKTFLSVTPGIFARKRGRFAPWESFPTSKVAVHVPFDPTLEYRNLIKFFEGLIKPHSLCIDALRRSKRYRGDPDPYRPQLRAGCKPIEAAVSL